MFVDNSLKQRLLLAARRAGVLPALDVIRFLWSRWKRADENRRFLETHPDFAPPPLWWMHDMYRHTSYDLYWRQGKTAADIIAKKIDAHVKIPSPRVADWGCGLARVLRHLPKRYRLVGFDYNPDAVRWSTTHIAGVQFFENGLMPPLRVEAESFDALYALSVFTHLSAEAHDLWIAEIERVLSPGGVFIGTFHMQLPPGQLLAAEQARFDAGELVLRGGVKEGSRIYTAHHPETYIRDHLLKNFVVLEGPSDFIGQSLFVAQRR